MTTDHGVVSTKLRQRNVPGTRRVVLVRVCSDCGKPVERATYPRSGWRHRAA